MPIPVRVANSPVWIDTTPKTLGAEVAAGRVPGKVRVQVFDHDTATRAGVDATLVRVSRSDGVAEAGPAVVSVDYSAFAGAYGGGWADRLRLVAMPACALTDPTEAECRVGAPVVAANNVGASTITAKVSLPVGSAGLLLALDAGSSGGSGSTAATSLQASAAWSAGANTGEFNWSYPMQTPPSLGGPSPALSLAYSSGSVDGRTPAQNAQPSWIGEGFEFGPGGFIERKFVPCAKDLSAGANNTAQVGDLCWQTRDGAVAENLTMSLGGRGGELIRDPSNPNRWYPRANDGSLVQRRTGGPYGDFWVVTTTDGTQYWFGGRSGSNGAFTVPVYGNHVGEPCRAATFATSGCDQIYRWNLDYVIDPHGNTMTYTYVTEANSYAAAANPNVLKSYVRGGYLASIGYGTRVGSAGPAPMQVTFEVADRCVTNCWSGSNPVTANWSDTPWDQRCVATPCDDFSPAFYTSKRLSKVTTWLQAGGAPQPTPVEEWTLHHGYPLPGDGTRPGLFLERISHVGKVGTTTSVPDVLFEAQAMPNRVLPNAGDGKPAMNWQRIKSIITEAGGKISVNYETPNCTSTSLPNMSALQDNNLRCFPVKWTNPDTGATTNEFFHKYVVSTVVNADPTGSGSPQVVTSYEYVGDPAWHYTDDDGLIQPDDKTWSVWRGYPTVRTIVGDPGDVHVVRTASESTFFQGMHGDKRPSGTLTKVMPAIDMNGDGDTVDVADVPATNDEDVFAGMVRRSVTLSGVGGVEVSSSASVPWQSAPIASRTINGVTVSSRHVATAASYGRTALDTDSGRRSAGWRTTSSTTTYDDFGMAVAAEDRGDDAVADDQTCRTIEFVRDASAITSADSSKWLMAFPKRVRDFAVSCATAAAGGLTEADIIADNVTLYDGQALGVPPTKGDVTQTRSLKTWNPATQTPTYQTTSSGTFDAYGRITQAFDIRGNSSTTAYTPSTGGPVTGVTMTNHLGWQSSTTFEPAWGAALITTDANARSVKRTYDGLGRLTQVWQPSRGMDQSANTIYTYNLRNDAPSSVTTQALLPNGGYRSTFQIFDALLRPRQTQADNAFEPGRIVSDTFYDSAGRPYLANSPYWAPDAAGTTLFEPSVADADDIPLQTKTLFDGVGRATAAITLSLGVEKWRTLTTYGGDRTDTRPPQGGTAYSTVTDASGKTTELRTYRGATPSGAYDTTTYTYNRKGQQTRVIDAQNKHWDTSYDLLGRPVSGVDPDKGTTTSEYNDYGDLVKVTDERGEVLVLTYDALGRKQTLRDDSTTGAKRSEWVYEGIPDSRGMLTKSIRWNGSEEFSTEVIDFNADYMPSRVAYNIPTSTAFPGLAGSYTYQFTYASNGAPKTMTMPDVDGSSGLPAEQLTTGYNDYGAATTLQTNYEMGTQLNTYVTGTVYTGYGEIDKITLKNGTSPQAYIQYGYEDDTRRLKQITTSRDVLPKVVSDIQYVYDDAGNTTKIKDAAAAPNDVQCFTYDNLRRLTEAWTPATDNCQAAPSAATLGGPSKYWTAWDIDITGNRTKQIDHATPLGDRTTDYIYAGANSHQLMQTTTVDSSGTKTANYGYDVTGNTVSRPGASPATNQILNWNAEGQLSSVTEGAATTSFLYDADGNRLLRKDATGTTLYLPGQEVRLTGTGSKLNTRYYTHAGVTVATRAAGTLNWLSSDQHGTTNVTINKSGTQTTSVRRETPYGLARDTVGTWPANMDKGFVGGTKDSTGLTHLGAREYDPTIGRFISADPLVDFSNPQQMQGYAYASNNPTSMSDATGLMVYDEDRAFRGCDSACVDLNIAYAQREQAQKEKTEAQQVKTKSIKDIIIEAGVSFLLDMFGITDIWNCISKGDIGACVNALIGALPWGKVLGAAKAIWKGIDRALSAYKMWKKAVNVAESVIRRADDAMAFAENKFDNALKLFNDSKSAKAPKRNLDAPDRPNARQPAGPGNSCHSFDPATKVLMADGSTKAIQDIKVGDEVTATDPETGETTARKVTALHVNVDTELADITIVAEDGVEATLKTTQNHPFWEATDGTWMDAGDLQPGDTLQGVSGANAAVAATVSRTGNTVMRDLTVADIHTYYVIAGNTPVLVHNSGGEPGPGQIYLWRAVLQPELEAIQSGRTFANPPGIETKYFSYSERGAAEFAKRMYGQFPNEGPYSIVRTAINVADIPDGSVLPHVSDVVDGGVALPSDTLDKLGRPRIMPGMSTGIGC